MPLLDFEGNPPMGNWRLTGMRRFRVSFFRHKMIAQVEEVCSYGSPMVGEARRWRDATLADIQHLHPEPRPTPPCGGSGVNTKA
jgi:hypothetical protein